MPTADGPGTPDDASGERAATPGEELARAIVDRLDHYRLRLSRDASGDFDRKIDPEALEIVEMVMTLEEEFGVVLPDQEAERILSIGDLSRAIRERFP